MGDFSSAKAKLLLKMEKDFVFFSSLILGRRLVPTPGIGSAGITPGGTIHYDPAWLDTLNDGQKQYVLVHEVLHLVGQDHGRCGTRNKQKWNIAADFIINRMVDELKLERPPQGLFDDSIDLETDTREKVYDRLPDEPQQDEGAGNGSGGFAKGDDLMPQQPGDDESALTDAQIKQIVAQASQAAKTHGRGDMSSGVSAMINAVLDIPRLPWYTYLYDWFDALARGQLSWASPNRRHIPHGLYLPRDLGAIGLRRLLVGIDTSGSTSDVLPEFVGHLQHVVEDLKIQQVDVLLCDAAVVQHDTFEEGEPIPASYPMSGFGGTDLRCLDDYVQEHDMEPSVAVWLTDGDTPWPDSVGYPLLVVSNHSPAPESLAQTISIN